jgi:hypothetical protein
VATRIVVGNVGAGAVLVDGTVVPDAFEAEEDFEPPAHPDAKTSSAVRGSARRGKSIDGR